MDIKIPEERVGVLVGPGGSMKHLIEEKTKTTAAPEDIARVGVAAMQQLKNNVQGWFGYQISPAADHQQQPVSVQQHSQKKKRAEALIAADEEKVQQMIDEKEKYQMERKMANMKQIEDEN